MSGVFDEEDLTNLLVAVESYLDEIGYVTLRTYEASPIELAHYREMESLKKKVQGELRKTQMGGS